VYTITDAGRISFRVWLETKVHPGRIQDDGLIRVFFLAEIPVARRSEILKDYVSALQEQCLELKAAQKENAKIKESVPSSLREAYNYRMSTIEYGISFYSFTIKWYEKLIDKLEKGAAV